MVIYLQPYHLDNADYKAAFKPDENGKCTLANIFSYYKSQMAGISEQQVIQMIVDNKVTFTTEEEPQPKAAEDLNGDGQTDRQDFSLAGKTLNKAKK